VVLAAIGGGLGLLLAAWLIKILVALSPSTIPRIDQIGIDGKTLCFTAAVSLLTSVLFGLAPALRISKPDLNESLKDAGRGSSSAGQHRLRGLLVVSEIALTVLLLVGAGLLIKSFWRLLQVNPGFNPENVMTIEVSLTGPDYQDAHRTAAFYQQSLDKIRSIPGVQSAGAVSNVPLGKWDPDGTFYIAGKTDSAYGGFRIASPDYFRTMSIPLIAGRSFTTQDSAESLPVTVIAQGLADKYWPGENPIGKQIRFSGMDDKGNVWLTIVGIAGNIKHNGLDAENYPDVYLPYQQRPEDAQDMTLVVKTASDPGNFVATIRSEIQSIDKNLPVKFEAMEQLFSKSIANRRYNMLLLISFAGLAMTLSMIGIYGVMSYSVSQSTHEIGIRLALGAQQTDVLRMVVGKGMMLTAIGLVTGTVAALALTHIMSSLLFGVTATDPATFAITLAGLLTVTILACYVPARKAMRVDPMIALRYE
jgi:putative ABC transport system permease protein